MTEYSGEILDTFVERRVASMTDEFLTKLVMDRAGIEPFDEKGFRYWISDAQFEWVSEAHRHRDIKANVYDWAQDETFGYDS